MQKGKQEVTKVVSLFKIWWCTHSLALVAQLDACPTEDQEGPATFFRGD